MVPSVAVLAAACPCPPFAFSLCGWGFACRRAWLRSHRTAGLKLHDVRQKQKRILSRNLCFLFGSGFGKRVFRNSSAAPGLFFSLVIASSTPIANIGERMGPKHNQEPRSQVATGDFSFCFPASQKSASPSRSLPETSSGLFASTLTSAARYVE